MFNPNWLKGKTIERVEMNPFSARELVDETAHRPVVFFTDGSYIWFSAEETDLGEYGVDISYSPPQRKR